MLIVEYKPLAGSRTGELTASFDVVIGVTPEDPKQDEGRNGRQRQRPALRQ
jgi:hypothetical protein